MTRRRFAFWLGICLFWIAEKTRAQSIDDLAAAMMHGTEPIDEGPIDELWSAKENRTWRWFERQTRRNGVWRVTGITTPIHKDTGQPYTGRSGYLDEALVPAEVRGQQQRVKVDPPRMKNPGDGQASSERRAREGRPPSKWLRSLNADEIRIWLRTIDVPPVGVSGMTFHTHLTRDHSFDVAKIEGLTVAEQAKLHSAAHYGY